MTTPGFTAEASLGRMKEGYALTLDHAAESGKVLPQLLCHNGSCIHCWEEGGYQGCFILHLTPLRVASESL